MVRRAEGRCQIGRTQPLRLAAIADGRTNIEKEREKQREADRRHQKASPSIDGLEVSGSGKAVDHATLADGEEWRPPEPQPEPVSIDAPKPPEKNPRDITMRLPQPAPETPEDLAAELMLLVDEVTGNTTASTRRSCAPN